MQETVFKAALAGLLHDIGKFMWRADVGQRENWSEQAKREVGYWHALASDSFVQDHVPESWRQGLSGPRFHHQPEHLSSQDAATLAQAYHVQLADWLSSGEREDDEDNRIPYLRSPFSRMQGYDQPWFYPLVPLSAGDDGRNIFPRLVEEAAWQQEHRADYRGLWDAFDGACRARLAAFDAGQREAYLETLYFLLQEFTWSIPSAAYRTLPDVSLFDHSRMTAALAVCFAADARSVDWCREVRDSLGKREQAARDPALLLIGGDISGVQRFIYTITSAGAARSLRGRSFYLQLLTEAVARYVLQQLELPITNLIYAGGGNFFLLAPLAAEGELARLQADVTARLLVAHEGHLHLALAHAAIAPDEFDRTRFHQAWDRLHQELARAKLKPLANLPHEFLAQHLGQGMGVGGDADHVCSVCGREIAPGEPSTREPSGVETIRKCGLCDSLEQLGNDLSKATHLVMAVSPAQDRQRIHAWWQGLEAFGVNFWAVNASAQGGQTGQLKLSAGTRVVHLNRLGPTAEGAAALRAELAPGGVPVVESFRPFAQLVPKGGRGQILTFEDLAEKAARGGFKRWGVLRMDVDNLGKLFQEGFRRGPEEASENSLTLSRLAGLSFGLRLFFEGWLPNAAAGEPDLADKLYLQYAGGDDLFVVGSWDALPEFALKVRQSFRDFACRNPRITLSGGIALAPEKYPLYQAAEDAAAAESRAKAHRRLAAGESRPASKDAFHFLGQTVGWEDFEPARDLAHQLEGWCGGEAPQVSKALLQTLLAIYQEYRQGRQLALKEKKWQPNQVYFGPWMWHLAYQIARRIRDKGTPEDVGRDLAQLERDMLTGPRIIENVGLAARWAQYLIR
jgi:CRISPR-associated protein Csm1